SASRPTFPPTTALRNCRRCPCSPTPCPTCTRKKVRSDREAVQAAWRLANPLPVPVHHPFRQRLQNGAAFRRRHALQLGPAPAGVLPGATPGVSQGAALLEIPAQTLALVVARAAQQLPDARRLFRRGLVQKADQGQRQLLLFQVGAERLARGPLLADQ